MNTSCLPQSAHFSGSPCGRPLGLIAAAVMLLGDPTRHLRAEQPGVQNLTPALPVTAPSVGAHPTSAKTLSAVRLGETPSAAWIVAQSPLMEKSAPKALVEMEKRALRPPLDDHINQDAVRDSYRHYEKPVTPEAAGSAFKYLRQKPSWRGFLDLFNPASPIPTLDLPAATAFENRRSLGETPRAFVDPTRHELGIRLF